MTLIPTETTMASALPKDFVSINNVNHGKYFNIFAIVKNVIKFESVLTNKNKHTLLALIDPSCCEDSAKREDLLLHIFINLPSTETFAEPFEQGDILQIKDMLGEYYRHNGHTYGKIYTTRAVVKFKSYEEDDEITPITSSVYQMNEPDIAQVKYLRTWWDAVKGGVKEGVERERERDLKGGDDALARNICDIEEGHKFDLYCKIKEVKHLDCGYVVLRVIDGTLASSATGIIDMNEIERAAEPPKTAELNSSSICVIVKETVEGAMMLKVDDFVRLEYIFPMLIGVCEVDDSQLPAFAFMMQKDECHIRKLPYLKPKKAEEIRQMEEKGETKKRILQIKMSEDEVVV